MLQFLEHKKKTNNFRSSFTEWVEAFYMRPDAYHHPDMLSTEIWGVQLKCMQIQRTHHDQTFGDWNSKCYLIWYGNNHDYHFDSEIKMEPGMQQCQGA